ncbi:MAG: universal stress protein [Terriglobales bacterium]
MASAAATQPAATQPAAWLHNILVATDLSSYSETALKYAAQLARVQNGKLLLAHALEPEAPFPIAADPLPAVMDPGLPNVEAAIRKEMEIPELSGIQHASLVERGDICAVIEDAIRKHEIELVVVGTRGREGLDKFILGSVAEQIIRHVPCPVLAVGPHVAPECLQDGHLRRVLYATDLTVNSLYPLAHAIRLAQAHQASLIVTHAIPCAVPREDAGPIMPDEAELNRVRAEARQWLPGDVNADVVVEVGVPDRVIVAAARERNASVIVMGLHQHSSFVAEHLPWTTTHRVVCNARCPVLIVQ